MGFFNEKLLDILTDESVEKLKERLTAEQYQKDIENAKQSLKDFLLDHYGNREDYNEIDKLVSNHNVVTQLLYWTLNEEIDVYQEIERYIDTILDISLSKREIKNILISLYINVYEELTHIDNPEYKNIVIRVNRQVQKIYHKIEKHLEIIENDSKDIKAILWNNFLLSNINIQEILKEAFLVEKQHNPSIDYLQISEELIPTINFNNSDITVISKDKELMSIENVFKRSWESSSQTHICITGIGGIGKTVCILETDYPVPAIYIPLRVFFESETGEYIDHYIRTVTLKKQEYYDSFLGLCDKQWTSGPNIILILDGVNEIDIPKVNRIFNELNTRWLKMPGVQFIITSRYDVETKLRGVDVASISVNTLSKERIKGYLNKNHLEEPKDYEIWKLINTPLMLKLYLSSELVRKKRICELADWKEVPNAGNIIWNYFQSELVKSNISHEHNAITALFFVAPFVAYHMVQDNQFVLSERNFKMLIRMAIKTYNELNDNFLLPNIIEKSREENADSDIDENKICNILTHQLHLLAHKKDEIQFVHQNFRDCLCAVYLIQIAENAEYIPEEWMTSLDSTIENYLSDLLETKDHVPVLWKRIWSLNNKNGRKPEQFVRSMLHLFFITYGKDISDIDFSGVDLSNICLSNYKLTAKSSGHFHQARISKDTFFGKGHYLSVSAVSWSCKGSYYISASHDCSIHIHSYQKGTDMKLPLYHRHYIRCAACSPKDERFFVSAGDDRELVLWHCQSDFFAQSQWTHKVLGMCDTWIRSLDWNSDGNKIACGDADGNIKIFCLNGEVIPLKKYHNTNVRFIKWSDSGDSLISGDEHGMICIWHHVGTVWEVSSLDDFGYCTGVNWINHNNFIVSDRNKVELCQITKNNKWNHSKLKDLDNITLTSVFSKAGFIYLTVFHEAEVEVLRIYLKEDNKSIVDLLASYCSSDSLNAVICASQRFDDNVLQIICGARDGSIGKININTEEEAGDRITFEQVGIKCNQSARCSCWSPDGKLLAVGYDDCRVRIWDVFHERCFAVLEGHEDSVKCVAWLTDEKIVSGSDDNSIWIWKKNKENRYIGETVYSHTGPVNSIVCLPDGRVIAGGDDGRISITAFDENGSPFTNLMRKIHQKRIYSLACNPVDRNFIVSGGNDDFICLWNLKTGECWKFFRGHTDSIRTICWLKDGQSLVTSSNDCSVMVRGFSLETLEFSKEGEKLKPTLYDFVYGACISGNDSYIVGGCTDSSVIFWDKASRECVLHHTSAHDNFVWNVSESPKINGNYFVATSSSDGTVKIWNTTKELSPHEAYVFPVIPNSDFIGCDFRGAIISDKSLIDLLYANGGMVDEIMIAE